MIFFNYQAIKQSFKKNFLNNSDGQLEEPPLNPNTHVRIEQDQDIEINFEYIRDVFDSNETADELLPDNALTFIDLTSTNPRNKPCDYSAQIFSPNHPGNYPNFASFAWLVKTNDGYKVQFSTDQLEIELGYDKIFIYDGNSTDDALLNGDMGTMNEGEVYTSSGNFMLIMFTSDRSVTMRGFRGNILPVNGTKTLVGDERLVTGCAKHELYGSGKILFQDYMLTHEGWDTECTWLINASPGNQVSVDIELGDMMPDVDVIKVYDGSRQDEMRLLAEITNDRNATHTFKSITNQLLIVHIVNSPINEGLFSIAYREVENGLDFYVGDQHPTCGGILLDDHRDKRIYYPVDEKNLNCSWTVHSFGNNKVRLHVFVSKLTYSDEFYSKMFDELDIFDGSSSNGVQLASERGPFSNNQHRYYESVSNSIHIDISVSCQLATSSHMFSHFYVDYEFVPGIPQEQPELRSAFAFSAACSHGNNVVYDETYIMFYDRFTHYDDNMDCSWLLRSGPGSVVRVDVHGISNGDYLMLYDGDLPGDDQVVSYTNAFNKSDRKFVLTSDYLYVRFVSDDKNTAGGFELAVERDYGEVPEVPPMDDIYY